MRTKDLGRSARPCPPWWWELKASARRRREGIFGFFKKKKNELEAMKVAYTKAEANVDKIAEVLEAIR